MEESRRPQLSGPRQNQDRKLTRPASAGHARKGLPTGGAEPLRQRPATASLEGRSSGKGLGSTHVTFFGRAIIDEGVGGNGHSRGSWQGRKFSLANDTARASMWGSGVVNAEEEARSMGAGIFGSRGLDRSQRNQMLDTIRDRTNKHINNVLLRNTQGAGPGAFIPKLQARLRSAGVRHEGLMKSPGGAHFMDNTVTSPFRNSANGTNAHPNSPSKSRPQPVGRLLIDTNLPSLAEADVEYREEVNPISTALSVDGEVALMRLEQAGPGARFCDSGFDATMGCLFVSGRGKSGLVSAVDGWKRPEELGLLNRPVLMDEVGRVSDVLQGALGDCYLLGAMSVVATRPDLLEQNFAHFRRIDSTVTYKTLMERGMFTVQLYKDCAWHDVTVDTRLPVKRVESSEKFFPSFGRCVTQDHMWVPILEKAFAKLYGGYSGLEGGSLTEAMADLTGGVTHTRNLREKEVTEMVHEGGLWRELQELCGDGNLMACSRNVKNDSSDEPGPLGLLSNHAYAILDVKTLPDSGHRLVLVRDPWGRGVFSGQWRRSSELWNIFPTALQALGRVPEEGSGSFWMSFEELVETMTTVHICRIFPAHHHSLSVRSEWSGATAGGPPGSETWFLNPQFRLSVAANANVVLSVVQFDHKVPGRTHKPALTGLVVLRANKGTAPVRMWTCPEECVVSHQRAMAGREVSVSVRLIHGGLYYVVPFTASSGTNAPYMLRCFSSSMLELQRVPQPEQSQARGQWLQHYAGGRRPSPTWNNNPQFSLQPSTKDVEVLILLKREFEDAAFDPKAPYVPGSNIGMCLVKTNDGQRVRAVDEQDVEGEEGFIEGQHACAHYRLRSGRRIVIIPSTERAGINSPFTITCYSDSGISLKKLPDERWAVMSGEWTPDTSGGAHTNASWSRNPYYYLHVPPPCAHKPAISITLSLYPLAATRDQNVRTSPRRLTGSWASKKRVDPLGTMLGLYIFKAPDSAVTSGGSRVQISIEDLAYRLVETQFILSDTTAVHLQLQPSLIPYIIMPATFEPGNAGKFWLEVSGNVELVLLEATAAMRSNSERAVQNS